MLQLLDYREYIARVLYKRYIVAEPSVLYTFTQRPNGCTSSLSKISIFPIAYPFHHFPLEISNSLYADAVETAGHCSIGMR